MTTQEDFLNDADYDSYPGLKFDNIGDGVKGVIVGAPRLVELPDDDGTMRTSLVVNVKVEAGRGNVNLGDRKKRPLEVGEMVSVWVSAGGRARAVAKAAKEAGAKGLADGGSFSIKFAGERDTGQIQPAKDYESTYEPPARSTEVPGDWTESAEEPF